MRDLGALVWIVLEVTRMQLGIYQNAAAMSALDRWNEAIAHNLASSSVNGYRRTNTAFRAEAFGNIPQVSRTKAANEPKQAAFFPASTLGIDFKQGNVVNTGRSLDVAITSEGFFEVKRSDGTTLYTRGGSFSTRADRTLVDARGNEVLGQGGAPIQLLPDQPDVSIAEDGSISQGATIIGKISVVNFNDTQKLIPVEDGYFAAPSNLVPEPFEGRVQQGAIESGNASAIREMVDMITVSRAYQASQKVMTTHDELIDKAIRNLG
ncbi:MAG: flagellar hook-basal body protein [Verrucomicrobiota bacterium]|nr:flagellar hook-basal body protein [Verrucomicrobiota bacterium]